MDGDKFPTLNLRAADLGSFMTSAVTSLLLLILCTDSPAACSSKCEARFPSRNIVLSKGSLFPAILYLKTVYFDVICPR